MEHIDSWPDFVRRLFWEYDLADLSWEEDRNLIIRRILCEGNHRAIRWLRENVSDAGLRHWLLERSGDHLSPRQLRFWELMLDLPSDQVDSWVEQRRRSIWHSRTGA